MFETEILATTALVDYANGSYVEYCEICEAWTIVEPGLFGAEYPVCMCE